MTWTYLLDCPHCHHANRQGKGRVQSPFRVEGLGRPMVVHLQCENCQQEFEANVADIRSVPAVPLN